MRRLLIVYNPYSSRFAEVREGVLSKSQNLKGYMVGKYEVKKVDIEQNIDNLAKLLKDDDLLIAAGGDATGVIAVNGIMRSGKDVTLAVLPYGNFNDLARTLKTQRFEDIFEEKNIVREYYPLEIIVDNELYRFASCYVTMGMMAEAVKIFDRPQMRKSLRKNTGRLFGSYLSLARWYFKNRRKKNFISEFRLNGELQSKKISDYVAVNGESMARVMKGGGNAYDPKSFRSITGKYTSFGRLLMFMFKSIVVMVPGEATRGDEIDFVGRGKVEIQAEGESKVFDGVKKIEIRKSLKSFKVVTFKG